MRKLALLAVFSLLAVPSHATLTLVTDRSLLQEDDSINWSQFGGDMTPVASPAAGTTDQAASFTLSGSSEFTVFSAATYNGDFAPTDDLVSNYDMDTLTGVIGGIRIVFIIPYSGAGAQVQGLEFGDFTATLTALGLGGVPLGPALSVNGTNGGNGDDSAAFIGVQSDALDIYGIEFNLGPGMAINDVTLSTFTTTAAVPEPSTWALFVAGAGLLAAVRRARA